MSISWNIFGLNVWRTNESDGKPSVSPRGDICSNKLSPARVGDFGKDKNPCAEDVKIDVDSLPSMPALSVRIPKHIWAEYPELELSDYDMDIDDLARNVLALVHNAVRREAVDLLCDVLPAIEMLSAQHEQVPAEHLQDLSTWWQQFSRFLLIASSVDNSVARSAFADVNTGGFRPETLATGRLYKKVLERTVHTTELALQAMRTALTAASRGGRAEIARFCRGARAVVRLVLDTQISAEKLVEEIDGFGAEPLRYPKLERVVWDAVRAVPDRSFHGIAIVCLLRWTGSAGYVLRWTSRYLDGWRVEACVEAWIAEHAARRQRLSDVFYQMTAVSGAFSASRSPRCIANETHK